MTPCEFVSASEFRIIAAQQPYFLKMTAADLHARNSQGFAGDEYLAWYQANIMDWTFAERVWMYTVINMAMYKLSKSQFNYIVPTKFVKSSRRLEQGFPHTLADVIVWSEDTLNEPFWEQVKLVIHESVHVWQRANPEACRAMHIEQGYQVAAISLPLLRNNPDTDHIIWQRDGKTFGTCYNSGSPSNLTDVTGDDHPNEAMAYRIAEMVLG